MSEVQDKDRGDMDVGAPLVGAQNRAGTRPAPTNPLRQLYKLGQSPWYDNIERRLFKTGEFGRLIDEYGIMGVTSNPTIFEKAISSSADYDEQIRTLIKHVNKAYEVYDELVVKDIGTAADMLLDVYNRTKGQDGFVSVEVLPQYARDPQKTVEYARRIFRWLGRRNILIKVPGTKEALPAITQLIAEGINVNVTLLFSVSHYEAAARAYIDGLKKRARNRERLEDVASVASVFVSRIDTKIDKMLEEISQTLDLRGKAAVVNSKMIYQRFKKIFFGEEFKGLGEDGAKLQRVLWASTSTKNPHYRDVKYVEELIGPNSINTMPHQTVLAFYEHGVVANGIENELGQAEKTLKTLRSFGIDIDYICEELQREGVKAFTDSFNSLIGAIEKKVTSLRGARA